MIPIAAKAAGATGTVATRPASQLMSEGIQTLLRHLTRDGFATEHRISLARLRASLGQGKHGVTPVVTKLSPDAFATIAEKVARQTFPAADGYKVERVREPVGETPYTFLYISRP